jgi:hypothetical protein
MEGRAGPLEIVSAIDRGGETHGTNQAAEAVD